MASSTSSSRSSGRVAATAGGAPGPADPGVMPQDPREVANVASDPESDASRSSDVAGTADGAGRPGRARAVKPGRLAVSETSFDKAGAPSPFGEDVRFPLPVDRLSFVAFGESE